MPLLIGLLSQVFSIGHGLNSTPKFIITKERNGTLGWVTYVEPLGIGAYLLLNDSRDADTAFSDIWGNNNPNDSVFEMKSGTAINVSKQAIAYCFAEVAGFSKFGSYSGNSSTQSINVGFEPAFVLLKCSTSAFNWYIFDNKRGAGYRLFPDLANAEDFSGNQLTSFDANGFTLGDSPNTNRSGDTYIYMAFANQF